MAILAPPTDESRLDGFAQSQRSGSRSEAAVSHPRAAAEIAVVTLAYAALAWISQLIAVPPGNITPIYPAAGLALACLLLRGRYLWLGIWLGQFLGNFWAFVEFRSWDLFLPPFLAGCITASGAVLQASVAAYLIRLRCGPCTPLAKLSHLFCFVAVSIGACTISSTIGVSGLLLCRVLDPALGGSAWLIWYLGDFVGIILFFPIIALGWPAGVRLDFRRLIEGVLTTLPVLTLAAAAWLEAIPLDLACNLLLFLTLPLLLWASLRIGRGLVAFLVMIICLLAVFLTFRGFGPFASSNLVLAMVLLQLFMAVIMITGLSLAISVHDLRQSESSLRAAADSLFTLRFAIDRAGDAVFLLRPNGSFVYANDQASKLLGYTREELASKAVFEIDENFPASTWPDFWRDKIRRNVLHFESTLQRQDGSLVPVAISVSHLARQDQELACAIVRDVTERDRAAQMQKLAETERENRLRQEQEILTAHVVQQALYPKSPPSIRSLDISGAVLSATHACGDYFDYIPTADGLVIAVGDVASHGLAPALQMTGTRGFLWGLFARDSNLTTVVQELNEVLVADMPDGSFMSLLLAKLGPDGELQEYVGAGHDAWIISASGETHRLNSTGLVLGVLSDAPVSARPVPHLQVGDLLLIVTDGVFEASAPDGEQFGFSRMLDLATAHRHRGAREIIEQLFRAVREFAQSDLLADDVTAVIAKVR